jgi:hypothetical protein
MKKLVLGFVVLVLGFAGFAQTKKNDKITSLASRSGDHIMVQLGSDIWGGVPDSIGSRKKGLWRTANLYVMMNKPFKTNKKFSAAFGIGISSSNMYFKNMNADISSTSAKMPFTNLDSANRFKKYKLTTAFLEVPVELRFIKNPEKGNKSIKAALGVKVGTLINVHNKGKTLQNKAGNVVNNFVQKQSDKHFFNSTRLSATARVGYGNFSLFASYQINNLLKDGVGPNIKPLQVGLCISGL